MNSAVPIRSVSHQRDAEAAIVLSPGTEREIWAERRRLIERRQHDSSPDGTRPHWRSALFTYGVDAFAVAARLGRFHARGLRNALAPRLIELSFAFPDLPPAFDGYRILHLSDTHLDYLPGLVEVTRDMLAAIEVDLLALTGDVHGDYRAPLHHSVEPLAALLEGLKVKGERLAVLGNHDPAELADALERLGLTVLINGSTRLERGGQRIIVTGLDDVHRYYTPAAPRALAAAPEGFRIALVHSAEMVDHAAAADYALYLCGHTHGGQLCLPNGRPIFTRLRRCRFAARGEWRAGRMIGYTSHGLGASGVPLRYNCPGEVTLITLRRQGSEGIAAWR